MPSVQVWCRRTVVLVLAVGMLGLPLSTSASADTAHISEKEPKETRFTPLDHISCSYRIDVPRLEYMAGHTYVRFDTSVSCNRSGQISSRAELEANGDEIAASFRSVVGRSVRILGQKEIGGTGCRSYENLGRATLEINGQLHWVNEGYPFLDGSGKVTLCA